METMSYQVLKQKCTKAKNNLQNAEQDLLDFLATNKEDYQYVDLQPYHPILAKPKRLYN